MKKIILAASLLAFGSTAMAGVGVSINVGEPGFYGQIDIGGYPPPRVVYAQPILVERPVNNVEVAPVYLRVPVGYQRNWARHCRAYNACGRRVFFVQDSWYANEYAPRYREHHDHRGGPHREERRDDHRGGEHDRGNRDEHDRGDRSDRGVGHDHGDHGDGGRR
jgi:hypothetical protein